MCIQYIVDHINIYLYIYIYTHMYIYIYIYSLRLCELSTPERSFWFPSRERKPLAGMSRMCQSHEFKEYAKPSGPSMHIPRAIT